MRRTACRANPRPGVCPSAPFPTTQILLQLALSCKTVRTAHHPPPPALARLNSTGVYARSPPQPVPAFSPVVVPASAGPSAARSSGFSRSLQYYPCTTIAPQPGRSIFNVEPFTNFILQHSRVSPRQAFTPVLRHRRSSARAFMPGLPAQPTSPLAFLNTPTHGRLPHPLADSLDLSRFFATILAGASNHTLIFSIRHPPDLRPVLLAHVLVDLDRAWIKSIPPVSLAA